MLIFFEARLVILAAPKTASTTFAEVLGPHASLLIRGPQSLRHLDALGYHRFIAPMLAARTQTQFETFALMRAPVSWLGSWYRYRLRPAIKDTERSTQGHSFDDFARAYCTTPRPPHAAVGNQADFLAPAQAPPVDHIFRYEDMPAALGFLEARLGMPIALPLRNASPVAPLDLSRDTARLLKTHMANDLALYDRL